MRLVDLLPDRSLRTQRVIAAAVILTQGGIAVTGAIVRVPASGLGCPTWPQCFPGSFTPVAVSEVPRIHQAVEFGNRMITFAVVLTAALAGLVVYRAHRRTEVLLYVKVGEPDDGVISHRVVKPLRALTLLSALTLAAVLVAGTLVTAAGPHAGDTSPRRTVPRLRIEITTLVHAHSSLLVAYLALLVGLGFGLLAVHAPRPVLLRLGVLLVAVFGQAAVGTVQFFTGVPAALVAVHVAGAAICTAATAALWASMRERTETQPVQG